MHKCWRSAAECLVASLALLLLTVACYRLHLNLATASLLFVIVIDCYRASILHGELCCVNRCLHCRSSGLSTPCSLAFGQAWDPGEILAIGIGPSHTRVTSG
jgi:hypothetical protein